VPGSTGSERPALTPVGPARLARDRRPPYATVRRGSANAIAIVGGRDAAHVSDDAPGERASDGVSSRLDAAPAAGSASGPVAVARTAEYFAREGRPLE
jgi:hypothetical protein